MQFREQHATISGGPSRELRDLSLAELEAIAIMAGEQPFRGRQLARCLWHRETASFAAMHELPGPFRAFLEANYALSAPPIAACAASADGTRKLLLTLGDGDAIESVIIPSAGRVTLCLSTQAGCAMGCTFCATALMGLRRNLAAHEITEQIHVAHRYLLAGEALTNYVFMGMGEPLANYPRLSRALTIMTADWGMHISPRRITVSTVGLVPMMPRLLADHGVNLAVSLHATTDALRERLVPINRRYPIAMLLEGCRALPLADRRRITFEYVMLDRVNDTPEDARRLVDLLKPLRSKVNLIVFNPFAGSEFRPSPRARVEAFQAILRHGNLTATIRESRGRDIAAACGQLYVERVGAPDRVDRDYSLRSE